VNYQQEYDDAMFDFSRGDFDGAIERLTAILARDPTHFDAQLSLGMSYYRKGDFKAAIEHGHKAEQLQPHEQLVHTNLSLFYMKSGDKKKAEHHGLQARIASWRKPVDPQAGQEQGDPDLAMAKPVMPAVKPPPTKFPEMPWKKKPPLGGAENLPSDKPK